MRCSSILGSVALLGLFAVGCGDSGGTADETGTGTGGTAETGTSGDGDGDPATTSTTDPTTTGDGDGDPTTTGDGDGDPTTTGDGDGDPTTTGDGDGDPTTTGDGDGDPTTTGDGDGDPMCPIGADGCPCTQGGGCDPGLECLDGICGVPPEPDPYAPCPGGDDAECGQGQVCVTGETQGTQWSLCTDPCQGQDECAYTDADGCADLPGDGQFMGWCTPVTPCDFGNPCPGDMICVPGFQNNPPVCVWPL